MNTASIAPKVFIEKFPVAKDSLKFADIEKTFSVIQEVPSSDQANSQDDNPRYSEQFNEILSTLKALQIARKSLSDAQSITKDIKSNFKTEQNDAWIPIHSNMLKERYDAAMQIKDIFANAKYNHKNVFDMDYSNQDIHLDLTQKDLNMLNLQDEKSINTFSQNLEKLSNQIEENIQKLQDKIDSMNQNRWLSQATLHSVKINAKEPNKASRSLDETPNLVNALAHVANDTSATQNKSDSINTENIQKNQNIENNQSQDSQALTTTSDEANTDNATNIHASEEKNTNTESQSNDIALQTKDNEDSKNATSQDTQEEKIIANTEDADKNKTIGVISGTEEERVVDLFV